MAYIYVITNNINGKQYVGKTSRTIFIRWAEHLKNRTKKNYQNFPLYRAFNKYGINNFSIKILEECNVEEINFKEQYWINKLDTYKNGYNATLGGDGKQLYDYQKIADTYSNIQNQKQVALMYNCSIDVVQQACKIYNINILSPQESSKLANGKKVQMLDKNSLEILKTFDSLGEAGRFLTSNNIEKTKLSTIITHISEVCKGKRKTAYGYKWHFI